MGERMRIAVAGATGRVGRHVVDVLEASGHEVVPISRSRGVDVISGEGLEAALEGAHRAGADQSPRGREWRHAHALQAPAMNHAMRIGVLTPHMAIGPEAE